MNAVHDGSDDSYFPDRVSDATRQEIEELFARFGFMDCLGCPLLTNLDF
jgi:hypothetical protein